ncbi:hypothetical protein BDFB_014031 [Asbolus verrucosus]|uniref:Uncharacterized protein n=1 Tax=Asbolus verrucosus TaxID=1661398 RepID=A0A482V6A1_ASBVE|nr:hypothetical protein BDFB_014031 [Asbolus verrucosus]
MVLWLVLVK